ncbi:MAG: DUF4432 family protein [Anaerolineae bacterium]|nr:DUF4432 family protein [Anaerolineae bacterium]
MAFGTCVYLAPEFFSEREKLLVDSMGFAAYAFRFDSGVCALRLVSEEGELVLLPFQGQQVWSATFNGRDLTMKSMFDQPYPTREFLDTFGGFMQHCGASAAGGPGPQDTHPLHGELPNAPYQSAYLVTGEDETGAYIGVGGAYQHTVAFSHNYVAEPLVRLYANRSLFKMAISITNLKQSPQTLMYLAHVNFRPVDHGRLVYSAHTSPEHVRVRSSIPAHIKPGPGYMEFIQELGRNSQKHHMLTPGLAFDPEVVFFIDYLADDEGWAYSLQIHPDGAADYIRHRPEQLPRATRWISRTADQDAIALVEAGTCEPEGYTAEKAKGNVRSLAPGGRFFAEIEIGVLSPEETQRMEERIAAIIQR